MQVNLEEALFYSKEIIKNGDYYSGLKFRKYSRGYLGTTENIGFYLNKEKYKKERALTVLASGDHVFNLAYQGFKKIDAFDINKLEYYVYYLKLAMLKELSYEEYMYNLLLFDNYSILKLENILKRLKSKLSEDVYEYYCKIIEYAKIKGNLENLYYFVIEDLLKKYNLYLKNAEAYLNLKEKINEVEINLYFGDVRSIYRTLNKDYDIILLSNIHDFLGTSTKPLTKEEYKKLLKNYYNLLRSKGLIINYFFNIDNNMPVISNSKIYETDLDNFITYTSGNTGYVETLKR